jgi:hypothetical protein
VKSSHFVSSAHALGECPVFIGEFIRKNLIQFRFLRQKLHEFLDREALTVEGTQDGAKERLPLQLSWTGFLVQAVEVPEKVGDTNESGTPSRQLSTIPAEVRIRA